MISLQQNGAPELGHPANNFGRDALLTYGQASQMLSVPISTLYTWVRERRVPFMRLGRRSVRFSVSRLSAWLEARSIEPVAPLSSHAGQQQSDYTATAPGTTKSSYPTGGQRGLHG